VDLQAKLAEKQLFILLFKRSHFSFKNTIGHTGIHQVLLVNYAHTGIHQVYIIMIIQQSLVNHSSFNLKKLGWGDPWTASKSCRWKLSVTGDTAKYLVLTLCRGGALFSQDSVNLFCHDAHFAQMAKWRLRQDFSEAIPQTNPDALHPYKSLPPSVRLAEFSQLS
jgi:hypothetical protein